MTTTREALRKYAAELNAEAITDGFVGSEIAHRLLDILDATNAEEAKPASAAATEPPGCVHPSCKQEPDAAVAEAYRRDVEKAVAAAKRWQASIPELTDHSPRSAIDILAFLLLEARSAQPAINNPVKAKDSKSKKVSGKQPSGFYHYEALSRVVAEVSAKNSAFRETFAPPRLPADSIEAPVLSRDRVRAAALQCGFKLKPQANGEDDINDYVYSFADLVRNL